MVSVPCDSALWCSSDVRTCWFRPSFSSAVIQSDTFFNPTNENQPYLLCSAYFDSALYFTMYLLLLLLELACHSHTEDYFFFLLINLDVKACSCSLKFSPLNAWSFSSARPRLRCIGVERSHTPICGLCLALVYSNSSGASRLGSWPCIPGLRLQPKLSYLHFFSSSFLHFAKRLTRDCDKSCHFHRSHCWYMTPAALASHLNTTACDNYRSYQ